MYFGSIKFFKRFITILVFIIIIFLIILSITLFAKNKALEKDLSIATENYNILNLSYNELLLNKENSKNDEAKEPNTNSSSSESSKPDDISSSINSSSENSEQSSSDNSTENSEQSSSESSDENSESSQIQSTDTATENFDNLPEYAKLYPDLYTVKADNYIDDDFSAYLTFEDCPSKGTMNLLDTLDKLKVKATFFITKTSLDNEKEILNEIVKRGHTIGIGSYSADWKKVYSSVADYLNDLNQIYNHIYEATNVKPNIIRLPGGSKNSFNTHICKEITEEITRRGFTYYDWNVSTILSMNNTSATQMYNNIVRDSAYYDRLIIFAHDKNNNANLIYSLPKIVNYLTKKGFSFDKISNEVKPITFSK